MKGLYLNVAEAESRIRRIDESLGIATHAACARHGAHRIVVSHHPLDWPAGPIYTDPDADVTAAGSGWLLFRGRMGDLSGLTQSICRARSWEERLETLRGLDGGAFVVLILTPDGPMLITDVFGMHPHYHAERGPFDRLAPSPHFIKDDRAPDPLLQDALERKNHLFGNLTAYPGILRLEPNALIAPDGARHYFDLRPPVEAVLHPLEALSRSIESVGARPRILPLSGGLDSRLLLASHAFDYGYTFGPATTGDRPVARRFAGRFREYREFSLLDPTYPAPLRATGMRLFDGVCARPFLELLPVYRMLHERWGEDCLFFDGQGGDILQRGTYLTYGGVRGSLAKLFPDLTRRRFDAVKHLRRRYAGLSAPALDLLVETFRAVSREWDFSETRRVIVFELLYGRTARHVINGGTILAGQYFTAVQPFLMPPAFRAFWRIDPLEAMTYAALRPIWSAVPAEFADVATYSGFKPTWNHDRARVTMLVVKGLGRTRLLRRAHSYERELPRIRWVETPPPMLRAGGDTGRRIFHTPAPAAPRPRKECR